MPRCRAVPSSWCVHEAAMLLSQLPTSANAGRTMSNAATFQPAVSPVPFRPISTWRLSSAGSA